MFAIYKYSIIDEIDYYKICKSQDMLEDVISKLPESLEISPIKTHGANIQARRIQIREKLAKLKERLEVVLYSKFTFIFVSNLINNNILCIASQNRGTL